MKDLHSLDFSSLMVVCMLNLNLLVSLMVAIVTIRLAQAQNCRPVVIISEKDRSYRLDIADLNSLMTQTY